MRAFSTFLATTSLLMAMCAVHADTASAEPLRASAEQMDQVTGTYRLSDGRRVELYALGTRLYARIGRGQQRELVLAGQDRFASRDGSLSIQFGRDLDTSHIELEYDRGPDPREAIRLASNDRAGRGSTD